MPLAVAARPLRYPNGQARCSTCSLAYIRNVRGNHQAAAFFGEVVSRSTPDSSELFHFICAGRMV